MTRKGGGPRYYKWNMATKRNEKRGIRAEEIGEGMRMAAGGASPSVIKRVVIGRIRGMCVFGQWERSAVDVQRAGQQIRRRLA